MASGLSWPQAVILEATVEARPLKLHAGEVADRAKHGRLEGSIQKEVAVAVQALCLLQASSGGSLAEKAVAGSRDAEGED